VSVFITQQAELSRELSSSVSRGWQDPAPHMAAAVQELTALGNIFLPTCKHGQVLTAFISAELAEQF